MNGQLSMNYTEEMSLFRLDPTRAGDVRLAAGRDCRQCGSLLRVTDFDAILQWLRSRRGELSFMAALRRYVYLYGSGIPVFRLDEERLLRQAARMLVWGVIHLCLPGKGEEREEPGGEQLADHLVNRLIAALPTTSKEFVFEGARLRIVGADEWARLKSEGRYQVVPQAEAKKTLERVSSWGALRTSEKAALTEAIELIPDTRSGQITGGILVLRQITSTFDRATGGMAGTAPPASDKTRGEIPRSAPPIVREEPEKPPPQPAPQPAHGKEQALHWIEIRLVNEDGSSIPDVGYLIVAPDGQRFSGKTDASGSARVDGIPEGHCTVSFPHVDKDFIQSATLG